MLFKLWLASTALMLCTLTATMINFYQLAFFQEGFFPREMLPVVVVIMVVWVKLCHKIGLIPSREEEGN